MPSPTVLCRPSAKKLRNGEGWIQQGDVRSLRTVMTTISTLPFPVLLQVIRLYHPLLSAKEEKVVMQRAEAMLPW